MALLTFRKVSVLASLILILPLLTTVFLFNYAAVILLSRRKDFRQRRQNSRKILITGASNIYGLNLARALRKIGHQVIGADTETHYALNVARKSRAFAKHYNLPRISAADDAAYLGGLLFRIVRKEAIDLWIDCTQDLSPRTIATARHLIEERTSCTVLASEGLCREHFESKEALFNLLQTCGLPTPELHKVKNRSQIHNVLNGAQGRKKYSLTPSSTDGAVRPATLLPKRTLSQTYSDVALVRIDSNSYMVLEECMDAKLKFQCFALIEHGGVNFFSVHSNSLDREERPHTDDSLRRALQSYTEALARGLHPSFSGHLTLSFGLNERITHGGVIQQMLPEKGSLRIDPEIAMSIDKRGFSEAALAYCSLMDSLHNGYISTTIANKRSDAPQQINLQRYIFLQAIGDLFITPGLQFLRRRTSLQTMLDAIITLFYRLAFCDEAYYDFQDPLPFFWQNTVGLVLSLRG